MRGLIISAFIYHQNENSPTMKYINNSQDPNLINVPFQFNLAEGYIDGRYASPVLAPLKYEPNISEINLNKNNLRESGLIEIGKILLFNKGIRIINYSKNLLKHYYIEFINFVLGLYDNHTLTELNLSFNYLKDKTKNGLNL